MNYEVIYKGEMYCSLVRKIVSTSDLPNGRVKCAEAGCWVSRLHPAEDMILTLRKYDDGVNVAFCQEEETSPRELKF